MFYKRVLNRKSIEVSRSWKLRHEHRSLPFVRLIPLVLAPSLIGHSFQNWNTAHLCQQVGDEEWRRKRSGRSTRIRRRQTVASDSRDPEPHANLAEVVRMTRQGPQTVLDVLAFVRLVRLEGKLLYVGDDFEDEPKGPKRRQRPIHRVQIHQLTRRPVQQIHR